MTKLPHILKLNARHRGLVSADSSIMVGDRLVFTFRITQSVKGLRGCLLQLGSHMAVDIERHPNLALDPSYSYS